MSKGKYYITTSIVYASAKPHIGNTYEAVLADAIARYKRLEGYDVFFQTGTDEHGLKIEKKAFENNQSPQEYVDGISSQVKEIWDLMDCSYDSFVRTTNPEHKEIVKKIFKKMLDNGDIYKGNYEGLYCVPCESFFTNSQLVDGKCPDCGREVTSVSEEAYFLKLSKYVDKLKKYYDDNPDFIEPISRKNEIYNNFIKPGLQDLCISRSSFQWGIPVPVEEKHVIYVWIDALTNYINFIGYDPENSNNKEFLNLWPADLHIIGKDILRFHMIYWPVILMSLGLELPKKIYAHSWYINNEGKISKSKGSLNYADELANIFGVEALRYYLLSEMPYANDGLISEELITEKTNSDLANNLGNLINRTIAMNSKCFNSQIIEGKNCDQIDQELIDYALKTKDNVKQKMNDLHVSDSLSEIINLSRRCNKYIDEKAPWLLAKDESKKEELKTTIYNLLESIRFIGVLLQPYMPKTSQKILNIFDIEDRSFGTIEKFGYLSNKNKIEKIEPLFMRIEKK